MELILQAVLEILFYCYLDFVEELADGRQLKKWQKVLFICVCMTVFFAAVVLVIVGIAVLCAGKEHEKTAGVIMLSVGCVVLVIHILFAVISRALRSGRSEGEEERTEKEEETEEPPREKSDEPEPIVSYWDGEEK